MSDIGPESIFSKFKRINQSTLADKESTKNKLEEAHEDELINQSKNRSKLGQFSVDWIVMLVTVVSTFICFMSAIHFFRLSQDPVELKQFLITFYSEIKSVLTDYQSVIAVVATLMFGDKLKNKGDKEN